jgi:hypothetical protein
VATLAIRYIRRPSRLAVTAVIAIVIGLFFVPVSPANAAATGKCYGAGCTGLDPTNRCDGDAYTVHSIAINDAAMYLGQLDLRYSPSCKANWGRFTTASGPRYILLSETGQPYPFGGRVTAWNPGGPSQQPVQQYYTCLSAPYSSCSFWSKMVDGRGTACTGVEPWVRTWNGSGLESRGWYWGPCA